jgi:preprotein translocase subunit SecG
MNWQQLAPYLVPLLVLSLIARRAFRAQTPRRVRPSRLWIGPVYVAVAMALVLWQSPMPGAFGMMLFAIGALIGGGVGYLRALHQEFSIDAETGNVMSKATPVASILFVGLFLVRYALNFWMQGGKAPGALQARSAELMLYTDTMLFFAFAMVSVSAWEVWRRTRPLVEEHKASKVALDV